MTCYMGGKQRIAKKISSCIKDYVKDKEYVGYCEPFCGMLGVYQHIIPLLGDIDYVASDLKNCVVMFWEDVQQGWIPPTTTSEEEFFRLKEAEDSALKCYIGHQYGYGGQFFKGYAPKYGRKLDQTKTSNKIVKIGEKITNVAFSCDSYKQWSDLKGYIIYCDPPYDNTYCIYQEKFDSDEFWDWVRKMSKNNLVFVSEYTSPKDFKSIWEHTITLTGRLQSDNKVRTEKLFVLI